MDEDSARAGDSAKQLSSQTFFAMKGSLI